jgi:hypothetical protein
MSRNHRLRSARYGVALMAVTLAGCDSSAPPVAPAASGNVEQVVAPAYVIGETVTVEGVVTRIISRGSFELDSPGFGDRSLLVVCAVDRDVNPGERIEVSGNVQHFIYDAYADEYRLAPDASAYAAFQKEQFLVSDKAMDLP